MRLMHASRIDRVVLILGLLVAAAGAAGWVLFYVGVPLWMAFAVAVLSVALTITALSSQTSMRISDLLGWSPAFALLTWPPLWLIVVLIRALLTGHSIGS
jgi:hypothetical protein